MASVFADDPAARDFSTNALSLSWLLNDAPAPIPRPDQLNHSYVFTSELSNTPATRALYSQCAAEARKMDVDPEEFMRKGLDHCPLEATAERLGGVPGCMRGAKHKTLNTFHQVLGSYAFGSLYEFDEAGDIHQELEEPVTRKFICHLETQAKAKVARYKSGAVLFNTMQFEGNPYLGEPELVNRLYLFDGFPNASVNGGIFPKLLVRAVVRQKRSCPFCAANLVVCECPDAYRQEFLPALSQPAPNIASMIGSCADALSDVTLHSRVHMEAPGTVPFPVTVECFTKLGVSKSKNSVMEFARREYERYFSFHKHAIASPLTSSGMLVASPSADSLEADETADDSRAASMERVAGESFRMMIEEPLQFFSALRISNGKPPKGRNPALVGPCLPQNPFGTVGGPVEREASEASEAALGGGEGEEEEEEALFLDVSTEPALEGLGAADFAAVFAEQLAQEIDRDLMDLLDPSDESTNLSELSRQISETVEMSAAAQAAEFSALKPGSASPLGGTSSTSKSSGTLSIDVTDRERPAASPTSGSPRSGSRSGSGSPSAPSSSNKDCPHCAKPFKRPADLRRHVFSMHTADAPRAFVCATCGDTFKQKWHLNSHVQGIHSGKKPFGCPMCEFPFARKSDLNKHIRVVHQKGKKGEVQIAASQEFACST